jgi:tetratricopeptide (TPR) repeat protein
MNNEANEQRIDEIMNQHEIEAGEHGDDKEFAEISELSKKGYQALKDNRLHDASSAFEEILSKEPENNYALVGLGDAARKKGAFREAVEHYRKCLSHHPGNNYALFGLADCYKALNQYQKAIEYGSSIYSTMTRTSPY